MKKKIFIGIGVVVLIAVFVSIALIKNNGSAGTGPVFSVETDKIKKDSISSVLSANGTVTEVDKSETYLDTPIKVNKVNIKQNDMVKKGQKLVEFDFEDINLQIEQAKLQKRTQELTLKKLKLIDSTVSVASAQTSLKVSENNLASAQKAYDLAVKNLNDVKTLYDAGAKSKSELDRAESDLKDAEIARNNAKLNVESQMETIKSTSKTNNQAISSKQLDIESQEVSIATIELNIKELQAKVKKYTEAMYSNMDGVVSDLNVVEGSYTPSAQPVFVVVNSDKLEVKMNINEYNAKQMKVGQNVDITGDSIPETEKITGKVKNISPVASKNANSSGGSETVIEVIVSIDNATESIKPGITVNCDIKTVELNNVLTLQLDMLSADKEGNSYVFALSEDKKTMKKKKIEIGNTSDMKAEIKSGDLKEGDLVVLNPKTTFKDGARVKLSEK